jgi:hypothetical protein
MFKKYFVCIMIVTGFILMPAVLGAQAFPIAVGPDSTFSACAVYGGVNGIVAIIGDTLSQYNITGQLVYPPDSLIGNRISIGRQGVFPGAVVAFDGTNYLMVWREFNGDFNGQFISTSGNLVGMYFTIATNTHLTRPGIGLCFGDTTYMAVFVKADTFFYGQIVSRSGNLVGGQIQISNNFAREISGAFDGTNFLVAWVEAIPTRDKDVWGQFVSKDGSLVGNNFLIDGGPYYSDNPTSLAFDGARYLLGQHESTGSATMLLGRFITTSGSVEQTILICDSTEYPLIPGVAFDGNNYLTTWTQLNDRQLMGRFWTPSGVPIDIPFVVFDSIDNKIPLGGCGFGGTMYLVVGSRVNESFTDGDVYGRFIPQTGIEEENKLTPEKSLLFQNYPNPFNQTTMISYQYLKPARVTIKIYNIAGQEVATLVDRAESAGEHTVIWDARALSAGVYFYRVIINNNAFTRRCLLVK